jgi:magnesium transporter
MKSILSERYPKDSVGELIDPYFLSFAKNTTIRDAVQTIRLLANSKLSLNYAYVVDDAYRLVGVLNMRDLLFAHDDDPVDQIMHASVFSVNAWRDREEVVHEASKHRFLAIPVVDNENHLLGTLKLSDLVTVAQVEATEDIQKMFGAGAEEKVDSPLRLTLTKRLPWLHFNLLTAFLAALTISLFEGTIAKITALAIFLPVVASQGGNTGAQSLAVVMRGLALNEISRTNSGKIIFKEVLAGTINGAIIAMVTGLVTWWWNGNGFLGLIIGMAMISNMILAAFFGTAIPLSMKKMGFDPAQCSNIILTTFTDVLGFFLFLGLAFLFQDFLLT